MCGIAGFLCPHSFDPDSAKTAAIWMRDALVHRGPDDAGLWMDGSNSVVMMHRRLSIQELSSAGHQPMVSPTGRFVICFNGEIYNHLELRQQLTRSAWRGGSDTETILACIEEWGLITTLKRCVGMFALALWDREEQRLALARDRLGEKPLYYGWQGQNFVFASELKAIKRHPQFLAKVNFKTIPAFLKLGYIPGPESIWEGIYKLEPGCVAWIHPLSGRGSARTESYWSLKEVVAAGQQQPFSGSRLEAIDAVESHLGTAVRQQMISDVPLGVFLSGGIDSSIVTALMQQASSAPINTFSIGFEAESHNEAPHAKRIAEYLGTRHHEYYVSARDAQAVIPDLAEIYDEPFADSSQIPTLLLSRNTARSVKVALTGDGGDELFAGYGRYFHIARQFKRLSLIPPPARKGAAMLVNGLRSLAPQSEPMNKLSAVLAEKRLEAMYRFYQSKNQLKLTSIDEAYDPYFLQSSAWPPVSDYVSWMMCADVKTYLPDDLLVKVDRAAMSASLETRAPFLSHELYEFCWSLPPAYKFHAGASKSLLKDVLRRHLPAELFERPKMGFAVPIAKWLRSDLREYAEAHLSRAALTSTGFLDADRIGGIWCQHKEGKRDLSATLWNVITLVSWMEKNRAEI
jgi:asparagine synthase (glutamine-hydrolysing)